MTVNNLISGTITFNDHSVLKVTRDPNPDPKNLPIVSNVFLVSKKEDIPSELVQNGSVEVKKDQQGEFFVVHSNEVDDRKLYFGEGPHYIKHEVASDSLREKGFTRLEATWKVDNGSEQFIQDKNGIIRQKPVTNICYPLSDNDKIPEEIDGFKCLRYLENKWLVKASWSEQDLESEPCDNGIVSQVAIICGHEDAYILTLTEESTTKWFVIEVDGEPVEPPIRLDLVRFN